MSSCGPLLAQLEPKRLTGASQPGLDRADRHAERIPNFLVAQAVDLPQDDHRPLVERQLIERVVYPYRQLFVFHAGRKERFDLVDAPSARNYFDIVSGDVVSRCPPGEDGLGVEIF